MSNVVKITSKGQVTIPKKIRKWLNTDFIEFTQNSTGELIVRPVANVAGVLQKFSQSYTPLKKVRAKVWEDVVRERAHTS